MDELAKEVHERVMRRSSMKAYVRNRLFMKDPQSKLIEYLMELELRIEDLEFQVKVLGLNDT